MTVVIGEAPNASGGSDVGAERLGYPSGLARMNLLNEWPGPRGRGSDFPLDRARRAAHVAELTFEPDQPFVLLGVRVASAFRLARSEYTWFEWKEVHGRWVAVAPHPSGLNHWWNEPANCRRAADFFESL